MLLKPDMSKVLNQFVQTQRKSTTMELLNKSIQFRIDMQGMLIISLDSLVDKLNIKQEQQSIQKLFYIRCLNESEFTLIQGFRSLVICEVEQAKYLKSSLQDDLIKLIYDFNTTFSKSIEELEKKSRQFNHQLMTHGAKIRSVTKDYQKINNENIQGPQIPQLKTEVKEKLNDTLKNYNHFVEDYLANYQIVKDKIKCLEMRRDQVLHDITMKIVVFYMSIIKNLEYDTKRLNQKVEQHQTVDKLNQEDPDEKIDEYTLKQYNIEKYISQIEGLSMGQQDKQKQEFNDLWKSFQSRIINGFTKTDQDLKKYTEMLTFQENNKQFQKNIEILVKQPDEYRKFTQAFNQCTNEFFSEQKSNIYKFVSQLVEAFYKASRPIECFELLQIYTALSINQTNKFYRDSLLSMKAFNEPEFIGKYMFQVLPQKQGVMEFSDIVNEIERLKILMIKPEMIDGSISKMAILLTEEQQHLLKIVIFEQIQQTPGYQ